jgi:hypothetical protein
LRASASIHHTPLRIGMERVYVRDGVANPFAFYRRAMERHFLKTVRIEVSGGRRANASRKAGPASLNSMKYINSKVTKQRGVPLCSGDNIQIIPFSFPVCGIATTYELDKSYLAKRQIMRPAIFAEP